MIEVKYDNDLEKDIETVNSKFNKKAIYRKTIPFAVGVAAAIYAAFGLGAIPVDAANVLYAVGGPALLYVGGTSIANAVLKKQHDNEVKQADSNILELANTLSEIEDINVAARDISEAIAVTKEATTTEKTNFEKNTMSKEEKIIKYFHLLDGCDQIQVLKQIATDKNHDNVIDNTEYETFLLEDKDLVGYQMPVRKKLTKF